MKDLTKIEEILLLSIWRLKDNAYGVKIRHYASEIIGKDFTYGNLYSALKQLTKKNYVSKRFGEPTLERRGRRRIYYTLSPEGLKALKSAYEVNKRLWAGLSKFAFGSDNQ
jgi:PadR family transcriptional regulator PadR